MCIENMKGHHYKSRRCSSILIGCLVAAACVVCHQSPTNAPTAVSRLDLLQSIVQRGTFSIDHYHTNTPDKAVFEGHYYSVSGKRGASFRRWKGTVGLGADGVVSW